MHIPDGFLGVKTAAATAAISAGALALALRFAGKNLPRRRAPLMGLAAAFIFAAQMVNFPIAAGTSGHLIGATLAATLLGPAAAIIVISAVLIVQCLLFADGGLTALGANVFNMAVVSSLVGYGSYALIYRLLPNPRGRIVAAAFAAWCATVVAAACCAIELAASGISGPVFPAMVNVHMLIGIGEATITACILQAVASTRPELIDAVASPQRRLGWRSGSLIGVGLAVALGVALLAPLACTWSDGLEKVAETLGFAGRLKDSPLPALIPDYKIPGIGSANLATALAGVAGTIGAFGLALLLAKVLVPRPATQEVASPR
jgi:cobalt/nickel transport system permease protein